MNTQELKEKADTLLALREDLYEMHFHQVDREWLIDAMLDFAAMNHMYFGEKSEKPINLTSSQTEISDEEIKKAAHKHGYEHHSFFTAATSNQKKLSWIAACKWYREQLKK